MDRGIFGATALLPEVPGSSSHKPVVAIAHDYLTQRGGAERVVLAMHRAFPDAPIYTTLYDPEGTYPEFRDATIITSPLNKVSVFRKHHRWALPLLPFASSAMTIPADVVLISSSGWAHGFRSSGIKLEYCHSPARWVYLLDQYLGKPAHRSALGLATLAVLPFLKAWDRRAVSTVQEMVGNSTIVQERIKEVYGKDVDIVHPPHSFDVEAATEPVPGLSGFTADGDYFMVVSRLLPYKNVGAVIEAFRGLPQHKLVVVGAGPMADDLESARPDNVRLVSNLSDAQMRGLYKNTAAVIAASHEDFGITPLEGFAYGRPALALHAGGYLDTVVPGKTGTFFEAPTAEAIRDAVRNFRSEEWDSLAIREHAEKFSERTFRATVRAAVRHVTATPRVPRLGVTISGPVSPVPLTMQAA